jgi:8-oxo-dGTP pyrophosphatase MutT (NUDIX family)
VLLACRQRAGTNNDEFLASKRLRHPYYGKVGLLTGKVRFEETIEQAVQRELYEETGMRGKTISLVNIYHKIRAKDGVFVQNNIFYRYLVTNLFGEFITHTEHQENFWATIAELNQRDELFDRLLPNGHAYNSTTHLHGRYAEADALSRDYCRNQRFMVA